MNGCPTIKSVPFDDTLTGEPRRTDPTTDGGNEGSGILAPLVSGFTPPDPTPQLSPIDTGFDPVNRLPRGF